MRNMMTLSDNVMMEWNVTNYDHSILEKKTI